MNALECLQSAAAKENRDAQYYLALMYRNGDGVPQDSEKMLYYLQQAASEPNSHPEALLLLGTSNSLHLSSSILINFVHE